MFLSSSLNAPFVIPIYVLLVVRNKLVYLCHITSKNESIRQLLNSKGVGQRVIKDDFIDHDKTVLLTYDETTSYKNLVNDSLV